MSKHRVGFADYFKSPWPMIGDIIFYGLLSVGFIICGWACWKGGAGERLGSVLILANILVGLALTDILDPVENPTVKLALDGITALIFVGLTVRFTSNWLGVVMLLYGAQFALNAYYFVLTEEHDLLFVQVNNVIFLFICISLAAGVIGHLRAQKALSRPV